MTSVNKTEIDMPRHPSTTYRIPSRRDPRLPPRGADWRCTACGALLGRIRDGQVHISFGRRHEYTAALPASCTCVACASLNRMTTAPPR